MKSPRPSTVWNSRLNKAVVVSKTKGLLTFYGSAALFLCLRIYKYQGRGVPFRYRIKSMHEVVPKVVAIAVRMVMANWMIFCQSSFFFMIYEL